MTNGSQAERLKKFSNMEIYSEFLFSEFSKQ